jgi:hypothetical protein
MRQIVLVAIAYVVFQLVVPRWWEKTMSSAPPIVMSVVHGLAVLGCGILIVFSDPVYKRITAPAAYPIASSLLVGLTGLLLSVGMWWSFAFPHTSTRYQVLHEVKTTTDSASTNTERFPTPIVIPVALGSDPVSELALRRPRRNGEALSKPQERAYISVPLTTILESCKRLTSAQCEQAIDEQYSNHWMVIDGVVRDAASEAMQSRAVVMGPENPTLDSPALRLTFHAEYLQRARSQLDRLRPGDRLKVVGRIAGGVNYSSDRALVMMDQCEIMPSSPK